MSSPPENHHHTTASSKRQRRPSVRLADLGGGNLISTFYYDHLLPRQRPRKHPLKLSKAVADNVGNGNGVSKSRKGLKKRSGNEENIIENAGDIGSWKARVSASNKRGSLGKGGEENGGNSVSRGGKIGSNVGSRLVDENQKDCGNEDEDLDGGRSNVDRNESGDDDGDRDFEPICSEEEEEREENRGDSFDKDNSDGGDGDGDGNENVNGDGGEKGRNGKDLRFQVSDEMDDPSDLSERNGVKVWLKKLGLQRYALNFEIHEVDDEVLPLLTLEDLKDMGITAVGSRRKMFCSIQNLNKGFC